MKPLSWRIIKNILTAVCFFFAASEASFANSDISTPLQNLSSILSSTKASITTVATACEEEPMRGKVYYYCDCGTGAEAGCVAGNDAKNGTSPSSPRRTIKNAALLFRSLAINDTVALCKGGAFNAEGNLSIGSNRCAAGAACNDLREYTPSTFVGTAKPVINNATGDEVSL